MINLLHVEMVTYKYLCVDNMPYTVWIWNVSTLEPVAVISCCSQIKGLKWTKKLNYLCIINGTDKVLFWR